MKIKINNLVLGEWQSSFQESIQYWFKCSSDEQFPKIDNAKIVISDYFAREIISVDLYDEMMELKNFYCIDYDADNKRYKTFEEAKNDIDLFLTKVVPLASFI